MTGLIVLLATAMAVVLLFLAIAIHEVGHLVGTILTGLKVDLVAIGPFLLQRIDGKVRLGLNRRLLGFVGVQPPEGEQWRLRFFILCAAGPLMSLIAVFAAFAVRNAYSSELAPIWLANLKSLALMSLLLGVIIPLVPARAPGLASDGLLLFLLFRQRTAERWRLSLKLVQLTASGTSPGEWPPEAVQQSSDLEDDSYDGSVLRLGLHAVALDRGDIVMAELWLNKLLASSGNSSKLIRAFIAVPAAYFLALYKNDPATARTWLSIATKNKKINPAWTLARAEAAVKLSEGDPGGALELAGSALAEVRKQPATGFTRHEEGLLVSLIEKAQQSLAA